MHKIATLAAAVMAMAATSVVPTQAQNVTVTFGNHYRVVETYCDRNPWDRDCRGFYNGNWRQRDYDRFYRSRRGDLDTIAAGLFGLTFGAIIGGAIANSNNGANDRLVGPVGGGGNYRVNVEACKARYRSYDVATNTFLGYDGVRHPCRL
ncbi:BA14K family protein [Devosia albogilva]|uniref:Lectin-like protein BA14k n=1 Tax=Devosia albogilva TaxID=429726 RepID=A0ABW5QNQ2_9HYPH